MESPECEASSRANPSFSGLAELPPKKCTSEREKAVICESSETHNLLSSDMNSSEIPSIPLGMKETAPQNGPQEKVSFDQVPLKADATPEILLKKKESEPSFNLLLHLDKGEKGESSSHPPGFPSPSAPPPSSRQPAVCKFCGQQFSTTQALGGHQNAHKHEREIQRAMKAAHEFATNPFILNMPGTRPPLFHRSQYEPHLRYSPYHGFAHRGWQPRSNFSHPRMSLVQGPPGFARTLDGFIRPSSVKPVNLTYAPRWPRPYVQASGPIRSFMHTTNLNSIAPSNLTNPLQVRENEHGLGKKQCVESTGLSLSSKSSETVEQNLPPKQNISSELDLTLKL